MIHLFNILLYSSNNYQFKHLVILSFYFSMTSLLGIIISRAFIFQMVKYLAFF